MGTTALALSSGSTSFVYVVAIEGYPKLLTNGSTAAAAAAWAGTDWTTAIGGLYPELANQQQFDPWVPFQGGGALTLRVTPDDSAAVPDDFGIAVGRCGAEPTTQATATIGRTDTTIHVQRTADFPAAPAEAYIGNECFAYSATTATTFTVSQRGRYSPFGNGNADPSHWAGEHRISTFVQYSTSAPVVSQFRRAWKGAWIGVWAHRVVGGVLDTRAEAQCVYAGKIDETVDDASGTTIVHCKHVLDAIKETTLGADQYRAKISPSLYLPAGTVLCRGYDQTLGNPPLPSVSSALTLTVVASGAVAPDQLNAGYYTAISIVDALNAWLENARVLGNLYGFHAFSIIQRDDNLGSGGLRSFLRCTHRFDDSLYTAGEWSFTTEGFVCTYFGGGGLDAELIPSASIPAGVDVTNGNQNPIHRTPFGPGVILGATTRYGVSEETGTFFDQSGFLPLEYQDPFASNARGIFLVSGKNLIIGSIAGGELVDVDYLADHPYLDTVDDGQTVDIVQVFAIAAPFLAQVAAFFYSSGSAGYNQATYDALPSSLSMGIPGALMPANFLATLAALPGSDIAAGAAWLTKPMTFADLFTADAIVRGAHLVFRNGALEWSVWSTPIAALATVTLDDSNKAEPSGNKISQRSVTLDNALWAKPTVTFYFDYSPVDDTYGRWLTLVDPGAIDAQGGATDTQKIQLRNIGAGQPALDALDILLGGSASGDIGFVAKWQPWTSRPLRMMTRSIAPTLYDGVCPGDVALVSDNHVRDPATGIRQIVQSPGLILRHGANRGGWTAPNMPKPESPAGEVDIMLPATNRATIWSPAADLDETMNTGGFTAGYSSSASQLQCKPNVYSEAGDALLDAQNFEPLDTILITEIDPTNAAAPLQWSRTVTVAGTGSNSLGFIGGALAGFDVTKKYRVTADAYLSDQDSQETDAFQADASTGVILAGEAPAFDYGLIGINTVAFTPADHTERCETIPTTAYGDGQPFDVGYHKAIARTINNLMNHRTAHQSPQLGRTLLASKGGTSPLRMCYLSRRFFGIGKYGSLVGVRRLARVAVWFASSSGTSNVRVTLARERPTSAYVTAATASAPGYVWSGPISQHTFPVSSPTMVTSATVDLDLSVLDALGWCWAAIECDTHAQSHGFAEFVELERS